MKYLKYIFTICLVYLPMVVFSQTIYYQDIFHGGVTAGGFSTGQGFGSGTVHLHIEPGSSIRKAFLFSYTVRHPPITPITVNGIPYIFDTLSNRIMDVNYPCPCGTPMRLYVKDITKGLVNAPTSSFKITIPVQPNLPINVGWWTAFLYIEYEKTSMPVTSSVVIINNQDLTGNETYQINNLNPINTSYPVGFSLYTDRTGGNYAPDEKVFFNSNLLGIIGGSDNVNKNWTYAGVKGHFYYQNNQLFGLDDDTPDAVMDTTDGLADVSSYLNHNVTSCHFELTNILYPNQKDNKTDVNLAYFLTYSTPCAPIPATASPDTTICYGETVQLHASGGTKYEWVSTTLDPHNPQTSGNPAPGLSCSNCPNPTFTGDSSQVYTVRIWSNDSCSVVRPVRVTVRHLQQPKVTAKKTLCGTKNGRIQVGNLPSNAKIWSISSLGDTLTPTSSNTFTQLPAGEYTVFYTDTFGCKSPDTTVAVIPYSNTVAAFDTHPDKGKVPLQVDIENQSQHADHFQWSVNGVPKPTPFTGFLADSAGVYTIQLVAWQYAKTCADTAIQTVVVSDRIWIVINNLVTPNNDGKNDTWIIDNIGNYPNNKVSVFNRWGNVVFQKTGYKNEWNGTANRGATLSDGKLPNGTYFYVVKVEKEGESKVFKGYLELER